MFKIRPAPDIPEICPWCREKPEDHTSRRVRSKHYLWYKHYVEARDNHKKGEVISLHIKGKNAEDIGLKVGVPEPVARRLISDWEGRLHPGKPKKRWK